MDMQFRNVASNSETSLLLENLKELCQDNDIPVKAFKETVPYSKSGEIIIDLVITIGTGVTSALVYDLLKSAYKRVFRKGDFENEVKIEVRCDDQDETETITDDNILVNQKPL